MERVKKAINYKCKDTGSSGYTGKGVHVAVLDTGLVPHPDLAGRILGFADCVNHRKGMYDDSGHGTHVCGILCGSGAMSEGMYAGIAPEAGLLAVKVLDEQGDGSIERISEGIQLLLRYYKKYRIRIVNISVGGRPDMKKEKEKELTDAVEHLWDLGMVVVVSAGNYGPKEGTVAVPGTSRKIITVGSSETGISDYSGCGPTDACVIKPDVVAPGYRIVSCSNQYLQKGKDPYVIKSGTSMATPVVSGAIALLLEKYPDMGNVEVKLRLRECCDRVEKGQHFPGWGRLNIEKFLKER